MTHITACIDGSAISGSVCDAAAWASTCLEVPLTLLHALEKPHTPAKEDLSGAIGLGSREQLLDELTRLDEQRARLALEHGRHLLEEARARAQALGASEVLLSQRHGALLETLLECETNTRLFVMGRLGHDHDINARALGAHFESVVRALHTPILVTVGEFTPPSRYLIAYDGSDSANQAIQRIASSPLLKSMQGILVMVDSDTDSHRSCLQQATARLLETGHQVEGLLLEGSLQEQLDRVRREQEIELMVMGAYGHSRLRELFVGSNTSRLVSNSGVPLLLLR
ncbi:universal stress protein [Aestuariirhabdus litorea]|uniref:Universal stress protein n=1 Tax=Aestuariirhabdus litorea TaxID=2528527 RepID=A0A3P3VI81_9GAMM|nr:universal stress protein [Aestuariirhabdus litorea]RRJ82430.1 universal stress protein [Aestuariirhabdus litorea]RWW92593.1 universal stress protein [Endozoicomonadaceae bacterium GTF-13]